MGSNFPRKSNFLFVPKGDAAMVAAGPEIDLKSS